MVGILLTELKRKSKLVGIMALILIIYVVVIGLLGKYNNLILAGNYITSVGASLNIISTIMMILASLSFGGHSNRRYLSEVNTKHGTLSAYLAQILAIAIEYVFLMFIDVIAVLGVQKFIFMGKALGINHFHSMMTTVQANAYYMFVLLPLIMIVTMGFKNDLSSVAAGIATNYVGLGIAYLLMIWVYSNRFLKWNPFNSLMIQSQIIAPINHTMTKLHNNEAIGGVFIYGIIYLIIIYWIFSRRQKIEKLKTV